MAEKPTMPRSVESLAPADYGLFANFPNPFNSGTAIPYQLPRGGPVSFNIYDALGQVVRHLAWDFKEAGLHRAYWDARDSRGLDVGSGVYFYRMQAGDFVATRRLLLVR